MNLREVHVLEPLKSSKRERLNGRYEAMDMDNKYIIQKCQCSKKLEKVAP